MALGAQAFGVVGLVIRQGMRLAGLGVVLGVGFALLLGRVIAACSTAFLPTTPSPSPRWWRCCSARRSWPASSRPAAHRASIRSSL